MSLNTLKRIVLSPGEPAGIGPDIIIQAAQTRWNAELIAVGDPKLFAERAQQLNLPLELIPFELDHPHVHTPKTLKLIPVSLNTLCQPGILDIKNAPYVLECLTIATNYCLEKKTDALVTGPIHKAIINDAGILFHGHTEFLAHLCGAKQVVMLFINSQMKVALATTHLPLAAVSNAITQENLIATLRILHDALINIFYCSKPNILVCGLNPHAGEAGHLGREEIDVIAPVLKKLQSENMHVVGPLPADTVFTEAHLKTADAILAMYHDQALPVVKFSDFHHTVNMTLGLPIIRTSVDHGTALDLAGSGRANAESLIAAIQVATNY
jgi:4-hydroxythreonine-4-phosphate dehydrogenase